MKSTILKAAIVATSILAVGAFASAASAKTLKYTFGNSAGGTYCDGVTLTQSGVTWAGFHTGCSDDAVAGGISMKVSGNPNKYVYVSTTDAPSSTTVEDFFLSIPAQEWFLYEVSGGVYTEINSGPLVHGALPGAHGAKSAGAERGKNLNPAF